MSQKKVASAIGVWIPECAEDGTYSAVQCDKKTTCWCVTKLGKEIPNTLKVGEEPENCTELQQKYILPKERQAPSFSWTHLWAVVKKWQDQIHIKVLSERKSNPSFKYKPNGTLVRMPKSSGIHI